MRRRRRDSSRPQGAARLRLDEHLRDPRAKHAAGQTQAVRTRITEWRLCDPSCGGGGGIRTHGSLSTTPVFKTGALNRSATPPSVGDAPNLVDCGAVVKEERVAR